MICRNFKEKLPDLLLEPESAPDELLSHVESCAECDRELRELRATMGALDAWEAPEVSPWFDARMAAMLRREQQAPPPGWLERTRARLRFGEKLSLRPLAAAALITIMAVGGGVYAGFASRPTPVPAQSSSQVIRDLQSLDENAVVFQQLNQLDGQSSGNSSNAGNSGNSSSL
ncbi:MAG: anti-sigma factor family protein [Acidobacteriota bacterium]